MKIKKKSPFRKSLKPYFSNSKAYISKKSIKNNSFFKPYIILKRKNINLLSFKILINSLKKIIMYLHLCVNRERHILIIGNTKKIKCLLNNKHFKHEKFKTLFIFKEKWIHGFFTNKQNIKHEILKNYIGFIIILPTIENSFLILKEVSSLKIPNLILLNTNSSAIRIKNYSLILNTNSVEFIFYFLFFITKLV